MNPKYVAFLELLMGGSVLGIGLGLFAAHCPLWSSQPSLVITIVDAGALITTGLYLSISRFLKLYHLCV